MSIPPTVARFLRERGVPYRCVTHPYAVSAKEVALQAHVDRGHIAKGVLLVDACGPLLVVVPGDHWVRLHHVQAALGRPGLQLADESQVVACFPDCDPGAVPPLGPAYGVETVVDEDLWSLAQVYLEAGDHRHLLVLSGEDFRRVFAGVRRGHFSRVD